MVLTKERISPTLSQLREMSHLSGPELKKKVQFSLENIDDTGSVPSIGPALGQLWLVLVGGKNDEEMKQIYNRFLKLLVGWSEGPFNLDFDLWISGYKIGLMINLELLHHLCQVQNKFNQPDVVRTEVSSISAILNNRSTSDYINDSIKSMCLQNIIPYAIERSEQHKNIQDWGEFNEMIELVKKRLETFLPIQT